jgi:small subunit ribosomal protein S8
MTDPIADFLTRIRNAGRALLPAVEMPHSRVKEDIARVLVREGYVAECSVEGNKARTLRLRLKYNGRKAVIEGLRRVSKPGLRKYSGVEDMPRVLGGLGIAVMSTPAGIMTTTEARRQNVGGEVLCYVW